MRLSIALRVLFMNDPFIHLLFILDDGFETFFEILNPFASSESAYLSEDAALRK